MEGYIETKKTEKKEQKATLFTPGDRRVQNSDNFIPVGRVISTGPVTAAHRVQPSYPLPNTYLPMAPVQYVAQPAPAAEEEKKEDPRTASLRENAQILTINENQRIISRHPVIVKCPHCSQTGVTTIRKQHGLMVYASSVVCCLVGMGPCALVPWCVGELKDTIHECHYCGNVVATVKRHESL
ncbi:unnamed protein product [Moneuplotes crassus]|uniref:LITAF domain-containing protein n=1 Tax=Euplotes crassus TaxID=5936 RepID=A0AAD1XEJ2_EUPCR|nr:unnamed protein product [Moneuplotes crassus]|mmetsp:Transcript_3727/g.3449  ORF Transcript_3727/g.3449 Transcript_3727/m.3449 type:complete len:183 (-) Transcript_3727:39-587(-)|eukprot:CAMPEP_0197006404 /NCGR_PEP_ID=MMETSP1380-20130617/34818_1 /TAXON_ID=5936 /ORGANISM="Euplotes crassus, Strain CT5" /LENGTH=182 /DNA_ID=CAMNT_0042425971 /DNA_START=6 /DNA_END=554 /DNA_ORIENTATION=+